MKINELFRQKTVLSFEVFPPKRTAPIETIYETLEKLYKLGPDFISVTYGAGGSDNCSKTLKIAGAILNSGIESVAHLPCYGLSKPEVISLLERFKDTGIQNLLALRGDIPDGKSFKGDFKHASDLIEFISENYDFNIIAACYPEGHTESDSIVSDMNHLKTKVDCGAGQLITQLFFDNRYFYNFKERCALMNIDVPIQAGIMPVTNTKQIERMVKLCGVHLPQKFKAVMQKYEGSPEALRDAGIAYAVDQIVDLIANGVDGIHLYTMNNPMVATKIYEAVHSLISV